MAVLVTAIHAVPKLILGRSAKRNRVDARHKAGQDGQGAHERASPTALGVRR